MITYRQLLDILVSQGWEKDDNSWVDPPTGRFGSIRKIQVEMLLDIPLEDIPLWLADVKGSLEKIKYNGDPRSGPLWHSDCLVPVLETILQHRLKHE